MERKSTGLEIPNWKWMGRKKDLKNWKVKHTKEDWEVLLGNKKHKGEERNKENNEKEKTWI